MDRPFPIKSTLLALLLALPVMAGERDERSMGDDAFSRGDYAGAVQFYSKALLYAKDKRWNEDALLLARAQLRAGDVAGAEKTYAEYRKRNPEGGNSAGMLPGELMLAAKNYSDAARYFSRLGETSPDPELQRSARFAAAAAFAEGGDFASAEAIYGELEKRYDDSKRWSQEAHFGLINTLIRSRQFERAAALLKERKYFGARSEQYLYNEMFRAAQMQDLNLFMALWRTLPRNYDPQQLCKLALMGAELAQRSPATLSEAADLLRRAFESAADDHVRKQILRKLINVESVNSAEEAEKAIVSYLKTWPNDPEKSDLLFRQSRLLVSRQKYAEALKILDGLIVAKDTPDNLKLTAIKESAACSEYLKDLTRTEQTLQKLLIYAAGNVEREEAFFLLGEFHLKQKQYLRAEEYFRAAIGQAGIRTAEVQFRLLETLIGKEDFTNAAVVARQLGKASQGVHRAASAYYLAYIDSRQDEAAAARDKFLEFLKEFPWSSYVQPATYHAAELAFRDRNFKVAADELLGFTEQYPESQFNDAALLLAIQSACISRDIQLADKIIARYDKLLPNSPGRLEARLLLADAMYHQHRRSDSLALLDKTAGLGENNPVILAEIHYQYARIALAEEDRKLALKHLQDILDKYSDVTPLAADAACISGNLLADMGSYEKAADAFRKALKFNSAGTFALLCRGRLADVMLGQYSSAPSEELLTQIIDIYRKLSAAQDYRIRLQSCCKLGRVLEMSGDNRGAFAAYQEALYIAGNMKRQKLAADPVWTGKAAQAALNICQKKEFPDRASHIRRITAQMQELGIPLKVGEMENNNQDKFTIQEK